MHRGHLSLSRHPALGTGPPSRPVQIPWTASCALLCHPESHLVKKKFLKENSCLVTAEVKQARESMLLNTYCVPGPHLCP